MSYQKSVALLCCAFLFSTLVPELIKASTSEATNWVSTEVAERTSTPESKSVTNGTPSDAPNTLPPDDEGPVITATPPADVVLYGCHADFTYSEGAMGKPDFNVTDDCGTVVVVSTYVDDYAYCAEADDDQPEGAIADLKKKSVPGVWADARHAALGFYACLDWDVIGPSYEVPKRGLHRLVCIRIDD